MKRLGAHKKWLWSATLALVLIAAYSALGILQALSLYQGERVLVNLRLWGSIMTLSLVAVGICVYLAFGRRGQSGSVE
jgi:hypothetical protein